ncbi:stalk domain-containing protein [Paenibacillus sp. y28]|uniref:stalk domain-containing protein n=1 Tax=Paenibacillus sp. y28 TaxID=3129110 RepID=UPI003019074F
MHIQPWMVRLVLICFLLFFHPALHAEEAAPASEPVTFADAALEQAVRGQLQLADGPVTIRHMNSLLSLSLDTRISDLGGLEHAANLRSLSVDAAPVQDFTPIASLSNLETLSIQHTSLADLSFASGLGKLQVLLVPDNELRDLSPLAGLPDLLTCDLTGNRIQSLEPLSHTPRLTFLLASHNEIEDLRPLAPLPFLSQVELGFNRIQDPSPLRRLSQLTILDVQNNEIEDMSVLQGFPSLYEAKVRNNPVNADSLQLIGRMKQEGEVKLDTDAITVYVNGEVQPYPFEPLLQDDVTLVPMRAIFEKLGASVAWDDTTRTVTARKQTKQIVIQAGSETAAVNGTPLQMGTAPIIAHDTLMVPLRFVSEALGAEVEWIAPSQQIRIRLDY